MSEDGLIWGFVLVNKPMEPRKREKGEKPHRKEAQMKHLATEREKWKVNALVPTVLFPDSSSSVLAEFHSFRFYEAYILSSNKFIFYVDLRYLPGEGKGNPL